MQKDNHDNDNTSPSQGQEGSGSGDDDKTSRGSWRGWSAGDTVKVPTKTHDGGGMDIPTNPDANGEGEGEEQSTSGGGSGNGSGSEATTRTTTTATNTSRPDNFLLYSDNDTRMRALLGLDPPANPNDAGEQQEDWRHHVGFQGLRERRNNDGRDAVEDEQDQAAAPVNGNGEAAAPPIRQTRLSWEVHPSAFDNMMMQRGELGGGLLQVDEQPPRRVERQQRGHGHEGENQNDDEE